MCALTLTDNETSLQLMKDEHFSEIDDWLTDRPTGCLTNPMQEFPCWEGTEETPNHFRRVLIIAKSLLSSSNPSSRPSACNQRSSHWTLKFDKDTCTKISREILLLFSRLYDVYTSSCAHFAIMLSSFSNCFYLSNLLPVTPFLPSFL
jgi:hypothetical protein